MKFTSVRIALMLPILLVAAFAVPALADSRDTKDDGVRFERLEQRLVAVEQRDLTTVVLPDGTTLVGEEGPAEETEPPTGTAIFITEDLFLPADDDDTSPADEPIGRTQITCEFLVRGDLRCLVDARVFDEGELHHTTLFNFEEDLGENGEFRVDAAITGGSGAFAGATGQTTVTEREDFEESGVSFYDIQAVLPVS
jgi:hypothetical protein